MSRKAFVEINKELTRLHEELGDPEDMELGIWDWGSRISGELWKAGSSHTRRASRRRFLKVAAMAIAAIESIDQVEPEEDPNEDIGPEREFVLRPIPDVPEVELPEFLNKLFEEGLDHDP